MILGLSITRRSARRFYLANEWDLGRENEVMLDKYLKGEKINEKEKIDVVKILKEKKGIEKINPDFTSTTVGDFKNYGNVDIEYLVREGTKAIMTTEKTSVNFKEDQEFLLNAGLIEKFIGFKEKDNKPVLVFEIFNPK